MKTRPSLDLFLSLYSIVVAASTLENGIAMKSASCDAPKKTSVETSVETASTLGASPSLPAVDTRRGFWGRLIGTLALLGIFLNTLVSVAIMAILAPVKLLCPKGRLKRAVDRLLIRVGEMWVGGNNLTLDWATPTRWQVVGVQDLDRHAWYLIMANHQSWVDILVLQRVFNRRVPFMKFFLKQELIWMPLLGFAWWILDFPFMKRSALGQGRRNVARRLGDLDVARRACEKFRQVPVSVVNFAEGTRFTPAKQKEQKSPFKRLLRPRAGGTAMVLASMDDRLARILDVTIAYPAGVPSFWELVCGRIPEIRVHVDPLPFDPGWVGDYVNDRGYRRWLQERLNEMWTRKQERLERMESPSLFDGCDGVLRKPS